MNPVLNYLASISGQLEYLQGVPNVTLDIQVLGMKLSWQPQLLCIMRKYAWLWLALVFFRFVDASNDTRRELQILNDEYFEKFGFVFLGKLI